MLNAFYLDGFIANDLELCESKRTKYTKVMLSIRSTKKNDKGCRESDLAYLTAFGETAKYLVDNATKGSRVNVSGRLQMARYISEPVRDGFGNELTPAKSFSYPQLIVLDADVTRKFIPDAQNKEKELDLIYKDYEKLKK